MKPNLAIVPRAQSTEAELRLLLKREAVLRGDLNENKAAIDDARRRLADERGVAFVRVESVRRELLP